ncbi:flagellar hook-associated protein FlgK [Litchfieldia salsa]|uniref:Flagellar hook-associated protein 1 n=1 Tax=Litchfieldia salsa TaxID=930152 RepID=A0A1H0WW99_9BACI|nr:flagellar hook-associated protein FlgK [Litchfieldia salsa]SDP95044.1 flagellar hook-associated protein 1 FlgK [Litchfieldia salsa]
MSTFSGLETARRGMVTQQNALYTTGHNISNANTEGYTRQRVNFTATSPFPNPSINQPKIAGQMGTGVEAGSVQRVRESFLDVQYRSESSKIGYWDSRATGLDKMEQIMNEPSESGLAKTMDRFWQSLQDLAVNPEDAGARSVVRQRGLAVSETFQYLSNSLTAVQKDLGNEINVSVKSINSIASQISQINKQISEVEPNGYLPNDLYDERDRLLDSLSSFGEIKIENVKSGGNALAIAEGMVNVSFVDKNGQSISLVNGSEAKILSVTPTEAGTGVPTGPITGVTVGGVNLDLKDSGKLKGLINSYGYEEAGQVKGVFPDMLDQLDQIAYSFATQFNAVHTQGYTLASSTSPSEQGKLFFADLGANYKGAATKIGLSTDVENLNNIAASTSVNQAGNGQNALNLAEVKNTNFSSVTPPAGKTFPITAGTIQAFYESMIGKMGVDSQEATRLKDNSKVLRDSVETNRQSVSGVSIDEEMTNMVKFQHAYNASARNLTVIDEMLDTIINRMGLVGR